MFSVSRIVLRRTLTKFQRISLQKSQIFVPKPINLQNFNFCTKTKPEVELNSIPLGKLEKKFQMLYTCKVCNTRNSQTISQLAYNKGEKSSELKISQFAY